MSGCRDTAGLVYHTYTRLPMSSHLLTSACHGVT